MSIDNEVDNVDTGKEIEVEIIVSDECENDEVELQEQPQNIGRLRKTLGERCECGGVFQLRVIQEPSIDDGEEILVDKEIKICSKCFEWDEVEPKRKKRGGKSKNRFEDFDSDVRDNDKDKKRGNVKGSVRKNRYGSH
jgi:hypothetical protein